MAPCLSCAAHAQGRGGTAWTTVGGDAQRTAWVRTDPRITTESVQNGGFQFLWKAALDNQPRQRASLTQPVLLPNIISYKGFKALAFVGGSSDNVFAIDYDLNRPFWNRHIESPSSGQGTANCPGALTTVTRLTPLQPPNPNAGRGSFLGSAGGAPAARGRGAGGGGNRSQNNNVYAVSSDGMLHALNPQTGEDIAPPAKFVTPGAYLVGAILVEGTLYAAASGGCAGTANGVYAIDLENGNAIRTWDAQGANIAGTAGPALSTAGTLYVAAGTAIVALDPKTLAEKDTFTASAPFTSSPVVFTFKDRELVAAANQDGRIYVLDAASLGGADRKTPLAASPKYASVTNFTPGALASWEESDGTRWIAAPTGGPLAREVSFSSTNGNATAGSIVAFKLVDQNGTPGLQPGWVSRELTNPLPPAVVNGIVFAVSGGESRDAAPGQRASTARPAVLYALDATTGRELWNSGTTMTSFANGAGPSAGDGQVYVVTYDGTVYAFGIPLEH